MHLKIEVHFFMYVEWDVFLMSHFFHCKHNFFHLITK